MIMSAIESAWHFVFGWPAVAVLIGIAATAAAIFSENIIIKFAIPDLRKWAICVAVVAFSFTAIAGKYYNDGLAEKRRQWDADLEREAANGAKILLDAGRDARSDTPDSLRNDSWNRGNRKRPDVR
jgi:hypothetical protein